MEEILASIRRIIADDQVAKTEDAEPVRSPQPRRQDDDILDLAEVARPIRKPAPIEEEPIGFREATADDVIDFDSISFDDAPEPEPELSWDEPAPAPRQEIREQIREEVRQDARQEVRHEPYRDIRPEPASAHDRLTSAVTDASVHQAFGMLASTVLSHNARTLEDLVQDMLRPMLKSWLDDNLPVMVERLVRAEIERVARGR
ncbi:hypothetical protein ASG40_17045 [Methylobacterium sp. Leaf399]|uniref:PopZ family protein n=1 Tax=unclassified Methylobacterium TaxID=2615210 RepID=UPI0006F4EC1F|nr:MULTISPECIES: DUF2497 domain-containing protein [unclassified Methylobacterium]KQP51535.1 hypothetical protein ASF39_10545 [Methylobacterium sp. Leaf108]KQT17780.1 hypothetical protein ASG40_17045 [Methylobacterium sp. Leaf399]KQT77441.1 hypothetical protein ASG59_12395 [Methylobacterium sp. Leaf466]